MNKIFDAALGLSPSERPGFVSSASAGDASLVCEVERLLAADEQAGDYLETPAVLEYSPVVVPLLAGDLLKGRFRIVREAGKGGMGKVFEAWDEELKVRVALKVVHPEIAASSTMLAAFRREVRIARTITHPNVCRTYDLDRGGAESPGNPSRDIAFLTMEFLEGETLAATLRRLGALHLPEALNLARQIASALDAAHATGIVHRDIKPANIMLVPLAERNGGGTRAVITDFGLARAEALQQSLQQSALASSIGGGNPVGTLAYMAPEQMETKGTITPATDVFAFGLVLFEMVTGKCAYPSDDLLGGIAQRLAGPSPSPRSLVPDLPQIWETTIAECLRRDPAARFQSAGAVVDRLTTGGALPRALRSAASQGAAKAAQWRAKPLAWASGAAAILALVALFAAGLRLYRTRAVPPVTPGDLVYLTPVQNRTGEPTLDNVTELLRAGLTQSAQINLLDQGRVGDTLQNMTKSPDTVIDQPTAREIAMRTGAARVVFATMTGGGGKYKLDIDIQRPDSSGVFRYYEHWPKSFSWQTDAGVTSRSTVPPELAVAVREATTWVRGKVGESSNDIARLDAPPEDVTTSSWEALEDYNQAQNLARQNQRASAVLMLRDAVTKDPQFALAYASMGDMLVSLHRDAEGFQAYDKALDAGLRSRLTRKEEDRIRGMHAIDTADYQIAVDAFRDYAINYKDDYVGWVYSVVPLKMLGRDDEAIGNLRIAVSLQPNKPFAKYSLAGELILQGRLEEALPWIESLRSSGEVEMASEVELLLRFLDHHYVDAARILELLHHSSSPMRRSYSYGDSARLASEVGLDQDGIDVLDEGLQEDATQGNKAQQAMHLLDRAYMEYKLHDFTQSLKDIQAGYALNPTATTALRADTVLGDMTASAPPWLIPFVRKELVVIQRSLPNEDYGSLAALVRLRTAGEMQLVDGKPEMALNSFRHAALKDAPVGSREYLGRTLVAAALHEHDATRAHQLLAEAMNAYSVIALKPAYVWSAPSEFLPGFYGDELSEYLRLGDQLDISSPEVIAARSELKKLRASASVASSPTFFPRRQQRNISPAQPN